MEFNSEKTVQYIKETKKIKVSKEIVFKVFKEARNIIYIYLLRYYQTDLLGELNQRDYFSVDESLFGHRKGKQIWILGIINNTNKDFCLEGAYRRDSATLEKFIKKFVKGGNNIITDGWGVLIF